MIAFGKNEWPYYDGIPDRDPNRILPEDVQVTISMNSFISRADVVRSVHLGMVRACEPMLRGIPQDADLSTFDADLTVAERLLSAACAEPQILLARAAKVLHRKRPGYIPMLDSVMMAAYGQAMNQPHLIRHAVEDKKRAGSAAAIVMAAFRTDVATVTERLAPLHQSLREEGTPMTPVRLLEVAVWMANETRGYYRTGA